MDSIDTRQRAHQLIDGMAASQVSAVVGLLETMLDPFTRTLANAPYDDEPVSDEDRLDIAESRTADPRKAISHKEVLAEFGLTATEFEGMGETSFKSSEAAR